MIVVDTNIIVYLMVPGENTESAKLLLIKDSMWVAPVWWRSEFRNVLVQDIILKLNAQVAKNLILFFFTLVACRFYPSWTLLPYFKEE